MSDTLRYRRRHKLLHWIIALLVAVQLILARGMGHAFAIRMEAANASWDSAAVIHALLGTTIAVLMLWRLMIRLTSDIPPPPASAPPFVQWASRATHWLFYAILIGMPFVGALAWALKAAWIGQVHATTGKVLIALIALHIAGAGYHHFIAGDRQVIRRMIPR
ncbi:hypothetical protein EU805_12090 [Salipiger sp. IMCC34102]|uniref:cytochrome b n=1 Tax=Salipiger sp. IMCC34102 TaxID=2510647 RepID=UPI00101C9E5D|nr:cytochrome b/b6 domain-containing protein [Salipiger sp. IMCC34102]RYH01921.1 hypothetical protein EU805_12090 [Salipiger sp. IMCC34102]